MASVLDRITLYIFKFLINTIELSFVIQIWRIRVK